MSPDGKRHQTRGGVPPPHAARTQERSFGLVFSLTTVQRSAVNIQQMDRMLKCTEGGRRENAAGILVFVVPSAQFDLMSLKHPQAY